MLCTFECTIRSFFMIIDTEIMEVLSGTFTHEQKNLDA